jgi:DNA-binding MarR family transcriptional regulator
MTKLELMHFLGEAEEASLTDVAAQFDVTLATAGMALLRLTRQALAARYLDAEDGGYVYELTPRGRVRLRYLRSQQ